MPYIRPIDFQLETKMAYVLLTEFESRIRARYPSATSERQLNLEFIYDSVVHNPTITLGDKTVILAISKLACFNSERLADAFVRACVHNKDALSIAGFIALYKSWLTEELIAPLEREEHNLNIENKYDDSESLSFYTKESRDQVFSAMADLALLIKQSNPTSYRTIPAYVLLTQHKAVPEADLNFEELNVDERKWTEALERLEISRQKASEDLVEKTALVNNNTSPEVCTHSQHCR
jgi:hypothetical protein